MTSGARGRACLAGVLGALLLCSCDPGSKDYSKGFYNLNYTITQRAGGAVVISGTTDLPQNTLIEVLVTTTSQAALAQQAAVLSGTSHSVASRAVDKDGNFTVVADQALTGTCHQLPPCGPFPAGNYWVLVAAQTPHGTGTDPQVTTYQDPRFVAATHGFVGFPGLEIIRQMKLTAMAVHVDKDGRQVLAAARIWGQVDLRGES